MPASETPVALGADFSAGLLALLRAAAQSDQPGALKAALDDPAVHTLVLALRLSEPPVAMLAGCLAESGVPGALAQWLDLSCI